MKICIFGGQFGSEGKGSIAEAVIKRRRAELDEMETQHGQSPFGRPKLIIMGENSPNSGHTNSVGKTRNLPVSAFFADAVLMGPDSVISPECLIQDIKAILQYRAQAGLDSPFQIYLHEHAAICRPSHADHEAGVVQRISSTGSGSGYSRFVKGFHRNADAVVGYHHAMLGKVEPPILLEELSREKIECVILLNHSQYFSFVDSIQHNDLVFECSQGTLLDTNFGYYPHVTSRTTLPRVAVERNGLGGPDWEFIGVYRTLPIRTGGPSGPTGAPELDFASLGLESERATVTKRIRRIFGFSASDFERSIRIARPTGIAFTHLDYINIDPHNLDGFLGWLGVSELLDGRLMKGMILSDRTGQAVFHD